jgi:hypothetical protein
LGVTYNGSQRIAVTDELVEDDDNAATEEDSTFTAVLDFEPADADKDGSTKDASGNDKPNDDPDDVIVVATSLANAADEPSDAVSVIALDGRTVTFRIESQANLGDRTDTETENDTVDISYARHIGADPFNALIPGADPGDLPVIAVARGSRVAIDSDGDRLTVDAESDPPVFSNASPTPGDATPDDDQLISIDITDDLAGVNKKSVKLSVGVGNGTPIVVGSGDLEFEDIGGGYRVSIALDDIEDADGDGLEVEADETPTIIWFAMAKDNANNTKMSDADGDKTGRQDYTFTVDGERALIDRAFTGDWFNTAQGEDGRVEGDRRLGVNIYQPGSSDSTSIRVVFEEAIDGASVQSNDFTVDGEEPLAATWYGEGATGDEEDPIDRSVFLTVAAMAADATPEIKITGSVSDKAGNASTSGTVTADDGIAPSPTVTVDNPLSSKRVTVTVETDERIRTLSPTLSLYVSDAVDDGHDVALDETDSFTVGCEDLELQNDDDKTMALEAEAELGNTSCDLALRHDDTDEIAASGEELRVEGSFEVTLTQAPILDESTEGTGVVDYRDVMISPSGMVSLGKDSPFEAASGEMTVAVVTRTKDAVADAEPVEHGLVWGDKLTFSYRGTGSDPARGLRGVPNPSGKQVSSTSWTFELNFTRMDTFAVTATVEDANRNKGTGGNNDPTARGATIFQIDNELADGEDATTKPISDAAGNFPKSTANPFFISLDWNEEEGEYPGDTSKGVTLTKAELDGVDVMASARPQDPNSYRLSIQDIALGAHTLVYNAVDDQGNSHDTDQVLKFTVQEVPTWDLELLAGPNLISLPSAPRDGNVNTLFGDIEEIELIFTFVEGQAKVARHLADGSFSGTLDTIDASLAYWISANNAVTVPIDIPPASQIQAPPFINVKGGQWNLVPVISLEPVDEGAEFGSEVDPDAYLGEFRTAFGWDGDSWIKIDPDTVRDDGSHLTNDVEGTEASDSPLHIGMGYWVLYTEDAIITP